MEKQFVVLSGSNIPTDIKVAKVGTKEEVIDFLDEFDLSTLFGILPADGTWDLEGFDDHADDFGLELDDNGHYTLTEK